MIAKYDVRVHLFLFMLNVSLLTAVGIVLHKCQGSGAVLVECPILWESMLLILIMRCLRMTLCAIACKLMRKDIKYSAFSPLDLIVYTCFFIVECATTSRSLNSDQCLAAISAHFDGHPLIAYVNGISCVCDGCFVLSNALFALVTRRLR